MPIDEKDAELVALARQGDKEAYGDLYERHVDAIFRYVFYRVGSRREAEDLTEQVFLKGWENINGFRVEAPFQAWLYRIAHNTVVDHYRKRRVASEPIDEAAIPAGNPGTEDQLIAKEQAAQLAGVIRRLSPLQQHVLVLRFVNGLSAEEIGQILNRSAGTVRVLQHRALKAAHAFLTAEEIAND